MDLPDPQIYLCPTLTATVRTPGRGVPQLPRLRPGQQRVVALPWRQKYFDGMETVRACGEPSYFVTVTANPLWPAIADALLPGQDTTGGLQLRRRVGAPAARAADSGRRDDAATAQLQLSLAAADIESCNAVYM